MVRNWSELEQFFCDSFPAGVVQRELRLSLEELLNLQQQYPRVAWLAQGDPVGGKTWYQVTLPCPADVSTT